MKDMREAKLMQSSGSLLAHIDTCEDCQWGGTNRCDEVSSLLAILRHDRQEQT